MPDRDIGNVILEGLGEIKAFEAKKIDLKTYNLKQPSSPREIRTRLHLSQAAFVGLMGVSKRTVQDWEQGRRKPSGPADALLRIAEQKPEVFLDLHETMLITMASALRALRRLPSPQPG